MSSCFFADTIFEPPASKETSLQELSQKAVSSYLEDQTQKDYRPFGFGVITIRKPLEIVELEELQEKADQKPSAEYDTLILQKKAFIEENRIERSISLDHFFTLTDSLGKITVYETNFILNDTLGVKDVSAEIILPLGRKLLPALENYFYEYNIFLTPSYYESLNLSSNFYAFFKSELERREGIQEKSDFLLHTLKLTEQVAKEGAFEQEKILQRQVKQYMSKERGDVKSYEPLSFSDLYQKMQEENENVKGYYFFHKFMGTYQEVRDTNVVLIEFNPYYEMEQIYQMDRPFDQYFNR